MVRWATFDRRALEDGDSEKRGRSLGSVHSACLTFIRGKADLHLQVLRCVHYLYAHLTANAGGRGHAFFVALMGINKEVRDLAFEEGDVTGAACSRSLPRDRRSSGTRRCQRAATATQASTASNVAQLQVRRDSGVATSHLDLLENWRRHHCASNW